MVTLDNGLRMNGKVPIKNNPDKKLAYTLWFRGGKLGNHGVC